MNELINSKIVQAKQINMKGFTTLHCPQGKNMNTYPPFALIFSSFLSFKNNLKII